MESMEREKIRTARIRKRNDRKKYREKENEKRKYLAEIKNLEELNVGFGLQIRKHDEVETGKTFEIDRLSEERKVLEEDLMIPSAKLMKSIKIYS